MRLKFKFIFLIISLFIFTVFSTRCLAETVFSSDVVKNRELKFNSNTEFKQDFSNAISKFENLNIRIAHQDIKRLIDESDNDFKLLMLADKSAELGLYDLSDIAFSKITDLEISMLNKKNIKSFYYPAKNIDEADLLILAEIYSNIMYNDQVKESIKELEENPRLLKEYDYANYLMALAYYNLKDCNTAYKYIKSAISKNSDNINYKILEAKIFSIDNKEKNTLKILKLVNSQNIVYTSLLLKIKSAEHYIAYTSANKTTDKDFHLGMYYFNEGDYVKSARILQGATNKNKKNNSRVYGMMSRCYFKQGDYEKASDYANKSLKITADKNAILTLGDIACHNGNLKSAIKYYKEASTNKNIRQEALEKIAEAYIKLSNVNKAINIYTTLIKEYPNSYIAYYKLSNYNNETSNLKKSLSCNFMFQDSWLELARVMIENENIELAKKYLSAAAFIDDNNFRYNYYKGLLNKKEAEINRLRCGYSQDSKIVENNIK